MWEESKEPFVVRSFLINQNRYKQGQKNTLTKCFNDWPLWLLTAYIELIFINTMWNVEFLVL